jgi:hypothetical protein
MPIDGRTLNRPLTGAVAALLPLGTVVAPQAAPPAEAPPGR